MTTGKPRRRLPVRRALAGGALLLAASAAPTLAQTKSPGLLGESLLPSFSRVRSVLEKRLEFPLTGSGIRPLQDSYLAGRSGGRTHLAIDIMAPRNTPIVAVADGKILKLRRGGIGGITIYLLDQDGRTRYYYAHLLRYAEGISEGMTVSKGTVIGYVGDTGNAAPGDYQLHFSIAVLRDLRRWWEGENVNPYPVLRKARLASAED